MSSLEELIKDLEEFQRLLSETSRPRAKKILTTEIQKIEKEIDTLKKLAAAASAAPAPSSVTAGSNLLPTSKITTYAWDQSDKFLKLYVTVPGTSPGQEDRIRFDVQAKSLDLHAEDIEGKNYFFTVKGLLLPIEADGSSFKVKKGEILLMLKKKDVGKTWPCVTETEMQNKEQNKPKVPDSADPNASLMSMMKQMYDDGDDEAKRTIKKAWMEAQDKKKSGTPGDVAFGDFM